MPAVGVGSTDSGGCRTLNAPRPGSIQDFWERAPECGDLDHMRASIRLVASAALTGLVAACSLSSSGPLGTGGNTPTGSVAFTSPAGGETYQIGDTVTLAWNCSTCANVPNGDYLQIYAYDGTATYLVDDSAAMSDSTAWVAGTTLQSVSLLPGTYQMVAQDVGGYYQSPSKFFQLVTPP